MPSLNATQSMRTVPPSTAHLPSDPFSDASAAALRTTLPPDPFSSSRPSASVLRTTLPPAPRPGMHHPPRASGGPPKPPLPVPGELPDVVARKALSEDWIPEVEDSSQIISLEVDLSATAVSENGSAAVGRHRMPQIGRWIEALSCRVDRVVRRAERTCQFYLEPLVLRGFRTLRDACHRFGLFRLLQRIVTLGETAISAVDRRMPDVLRRLSQKLFPASIRNRFAVGTRLSTLPGMWIRGATLAHGVLLLLVLGWAVVLWCVAVSSSDGSTLPSIPASAESDRPGVAAKMPQSAGVKDPSTKATTAVPDTAEATGARTRQQTARFPESDAACLPLSEYPAFPWKANLQQRLSASGLSRICQLMGASEDTMTTMISGNGPMRRSTVDGFPGGRTLVFQHGTAISRVETDEPGIRLWFHSDQLFRMDIDYGKSRDGLFSVRELEAATGEDAQRIREPSGTRGNRLLDGAVQVAWLDRKMPENVSILRFSSHAAEANLRAQLDALEAGTRLLNEGNRHMDAHRYVDAQKAFEQALQQNPHLAGASVALSDAWIRSGDMDNAAVAARRGINLNPEPALQAVAFSRLATVDLFSGDRKAAMASLERAGVLDPATEAWRQASAELATGNYLLATVALTAARMSCLQKRNTTAPVVLARGNFPNMASFFDALESATRDGRFETIKKKYERQECR